MAKPPAASPSPATTAPPEQTERTVTVSATGAVSAEPDVAHIATGVVSDGDTAEAALKANTAAMKRVVEGLKRLGITAADMQTVAFSVEPRYEAKPQAGTAPQITGYRVLNQLRITVRALDRLGGILDTMIGLGANQMHGLAFEVSNAETLKDEARRVAIANALRRAELYAAAAGAKVGKVLAIAEGGAHAGPRGGMMARAMLESVPVERGSQSLEIGVCVTWALL